MKGYFASRKLLLLLNLLRKLGNLSVEMATANSPACQRLDVPLSAALTSYEREKIPGLRMVVMDRGIMGRKVDGGGCIFRGASPDRADVPSKEATLGSI